MYKYRPNGAFKLLTSILYGEYSHMEVLPRGVIQLNSIRKLARLLGTQSCKVNRYLQWLEDQGYIETLQYAPDRRKCKFRVRPPTNYIYGKMK